MGREIAIWILRTFFVCLTIGDFMVAIAYTAVMPQSPLLLLSGIVLVGVTIWAFEPVPQPDNENKEKQVDELHRNHPDTASEGG